MAEDNETASDSLSVRIIGNEVDGFAVRPSWRPSMGFPPGMFGVKGQYRTRASAEDAAAKMLAEERSRRSTRIDIVLT